MSELKTLKDLNLKASEYSDAEYILKQEAIKWVKELIRIQSITKVSAQMELPTRICNGKHWDWIAINGMNDESDGAVKVLRSFFNITVEDLKGE